MSFLSRLFSKPYTTISPEQAAELANDGALLVDVREPYEWQAGHAPNARHIPLGQLPARSGDMLPTGRPVITVCRSGNRSRRAAALLATDGRQVFNLGGGMYAWARAGLPVIVKGGRAGRVV